MRSHTKSHFRSGHPAGHLSTPETMEIVEIRAARTDAAKQQNDLWIEHDQNRTTPPGTTSARRPKPVRDPLMTNDEAPRGHSNEPEQPTADGTVDAAIERIRNVLREYPWHIGRSGRIRATLLEETHEKDEETACPIAMLSMHTSDRQIETVLANPAHQQWAERVEETVRTEVAEHVEAIDEDNDSAPLTGMNELRRYAAALLIKTTSRRATQPLNWSASNRRQSCGSPTPPMTPRTRSASDSHARSPPTTTNSKPSTRRCTTNRCPRTERQDHNPPPRTERPPRCRRRTDFPAERWARRSRR